MRAATGTDFAEYRGSMIARRVAHHVARLGCATPREYLERLDAAPAELVRLAERLTVKVSRFWRNAAAFETLRAQVLPEALLRSGGQPLRIWSAGTAGGQEAYSLAIALEELGVARGSVLGTDVDGAALASARGAVYRSADLAELPRELRDRWFTPAEGRIDAFRVAPGPRGRARFARHDLASGEAPSPLRFHLVCCRNVLIYFSPALRRRVLASLVHALEPGGHLCLGEAEWPDEETLARVAIVDRETRIFSRVEGDARRAA